MAEHLQVRESEGELSSTFHQEPGAQSSNRVRVYGCNLYLLVIITNERLAKPGRPCTAIRCDPLFLDEMTLIFAVEDIATLEDESHGVLMERQGAAADVAHQHLLLEARFSEPALCAQCMVAAARALPTRKAGCYMLFDLPPGDLWGQLRAHAERAWL